MRFKMGEQRTATLFACERRAFTDHSAIRGPGSADPGRGGVGGEIVRGTGGKRVPSGDNGEAVSDTKVGAYTRIRHGSAGSDDKSECC